MAPNNNKFITLFGTPKINAAVSPKFLTPKPKEPSCITIGYSTFTKEDPDSVQWTEYCRNKDLSFKLLELVNNDVFYVFIDNDRKLMYRLYKNLSKLEISTHEKTWVCMYVNGMIGQYLSPDNEEQSNNNDRSFNVDYKSKVTIVCVGSSNIPYFDLMKKNHLRYAKYCKYNYYYYDIPKIYDSNVLFNHTDSLYILSISTKCIFTKLEPCVTSVGKRTNSNIIATTIDNATICTHMIIFQMNIHMVHQRISIFLTRK